MKNNKLSMKEQRKLYKNKCKQLGGFINVVYEDNKCLLEDIEISQANKLRLLYLATFIKYNDNALYIKQGSKLKPMTQKDIMKIMKLGKTTFFSFIKEMKSKELIIEKDGAFYINEKYFYKGKKRNTSLRLFINPMRELYNCMDSRKHSMIFNFIEPITIYTNDFIDVKKSLRYHNKHGYQNLNDVISLTNDLLITDKKGGKYKLNENLITTKSSFEMLNLEYGSVFYSKGEERIVDFLSDNDIKFEKEKEFKGLNGLGNEPLRYDFYLPEFNLLIEYHGEQHKQYTPFFHKKYENFERLKIHDNMKIKYAIDNNMELLTIWFYSLDDIEYILENHLF